MKKMLSVLTVCAMGLLAFSGCGAASAQSGSADTATHDTAIVLSDDKITVDGANASTDPKAAVYTGASIVYYHDGTDEGYGEGSEADMHTQQEADAHTVVTITQPGTYRVSGSLSAGQIAIDLGEDAENDPNASVTLVLDNASITCTVAPAIIVYNAYECGSDEEDGASSQVDTSAAGFKLLLKDGTDNRVNGSYVAKIYEKGSDDTQHRYDAAIESLVSWEISGDTGTLAVNAEKEGLESALHFTLNGGKVSITSGDDSVNANEDGVSVITINGGELRCEAFGGSEGDGIDSNGWIVMNGGVVTAAANSRSQDSGVDSDNGILINGGSLIADGNMYDEISSDSAQQYLVLQFTQQRDGEKLLLLCNDENEAQLAFQTAGSGSVVVVSAPGLTEGNAALYEVSSVTGTQSGGVYTDITAYEDAVQLGYTGQQAGDRGGAPDGKEEQRPQRPADGQKPDAVAGATESSDSDEDAPDAVAGATTKENSAPNSPDAVAGATTKENSSSNAPGAVAGATPDEKDGQMPQDMPAQGGQASLGAVNSVFTLSAQNCVFFGVQAIS